MVAEHPWEALPPEVAEVLRPELPALADEIVTELSHGVPDYARPLEGPFGKALRSGVEEALGRFTSMVENPGADRDEGREVYLNLGRGEMRAGRSLDALLAAYRLGARVAWRRLAAAGERAGLSPHTLYALAEAIFAYIDELSADSIEAEAANAAWRLPRSLTALVVDAAEESGEQADRLALRLGPEALVAHVAPFIVALVPAGGPRAELEAAVRGRQAALGPAVTWQEAGVSFMRASELLRLARGGGIDDTGGLLLADTHKLSLLLGVDRRLARDVADTALAPLEAETELSRERLGSTLDAWLRHRGRTEAVAKALHVHPQTVRYRLARLRELFGQRLEDPDARFELELALRARRLAG